MKLKKALLTTSAILLAAVSMISTPVHADAVFQTDVSSATDTSCLIGIDGTFIQNSKAVIDRVNAIRLEACREGVRNPNTGQPLTEADYVPIKWSSDLEYIAKIRAAESFITDDHVRTNGSSCFNIKSPSGIRSYGEVLAWSGYYDIIKSVNMWYEEKYDWVNKTGEVTGHYTSMINPKNTYFGMGLFDPDEPGWDCAAGEFSSGGNHAETPSKGNVHGRQILELANTYVERISPLTGAKSGKIGEVTTVSASVYSREVDNLAVFESYGWKSSDTSVATVNKKGEVTGVGCGTTVISLSINGKTSSMNYSVNHEYGDWTITKEPGCETKGEKTRSCKTCNKTETVEIAATGHRMDTMDSVAPTCTKDGYTVKKCSVCGYEEKTVLPALQHKNTRIVNAVAATCIKEGYTGDTVCNDCGQTVKKGTAVKANGHTGVVRGAKAATCTSAGYTGDTYCSVCGAQLSSGKATNASGHSFGGWSVTKNPTSLEEGAQARTCSKCGIRETTAISRLAATGNLNANSFPLKVKQAAKLTVNNMAAGDYVISWTTSDAGKASVDRNGKVTGKKKGSATITCKLASGYTMTAKVTVQTGQVKTKTISVNTKNIVLKKGQKIQLTAVKAPFTSQQGISYSSKSGKIATVSKSGWITAKAVGTTNIYVKSGNKKVTVKVTVQGVPTNELRSNQPGQVTVKRGKSLTWKVTKVPANSSDKVTYTSSNKKIATVNGSGKVTGKVTGKKKGTATITAKAGNKKIYLKVTVQ